MTIPFTLNMLAHQRHLAHVCAAWERAEWGGTEEECLAEFVAAQAEGLPLTVVAVDGAGQAVGMVSLWENDCPLRPEISPWVASLYVAPGARGQGLGTELFARIEEEARRLGLTRLHLMTQHSEAHYRGLGWETFERIDGPGSMAGAALMRKDLQAPRAVTQ